MASLSQSRRRTIATACLLGALAVSIAGCTPTWSSSPEEKQIKLPATWTASPDSYVGTPPADDKLPQVTLHTDGTAEVAQLPMGKLGKRDSHVCFTPSGKTYTGGAKWSAKDGGLLRIEHQRTTIIWASGGLMGSLDWAEIRLADCKADHMVLTGPHYRD